jgi:hypothetical protein
LPEHEVTLFTLTSCFCVHACVCVCVCACVCVCMRACAYLRAYINPLNPELNPIC